MDKTASPGCLKDSLSMNENLNKTTITPERQGQK